MRSDWLSSWLGSWPKDLPRLYPHLDDRLLSCFLTEAEHRLICRMPAAAALPLYSEKSSSVDRAFGAALARLITRDLMLLDTASVHGPDEAPALPLERAVEAYASRPRSVIWVTGEAHIEEGLCKVDFRILRPDRPPEDLEIRGAMFREFVSECVTRIAEAIGAEIGEAVRPRWAEGRPANVVNLLKFGELLVADLPGRERSRKAMLLWQEDMGFSVVLQAIGDQESKYRVMLLEGFKRDPHNVALLCQLFNAVRETNGHEPYAVQFVRKAIELSPGYGRAHLYMPEAAHPDANLLRHSELAHRLMPGNLDALCGYLAALCRAGRPAKELTEVVREAINVDPYDPDNYHRVIDVFVSLKQFRYALEIAKGLQQLVEPEIHPRTKRCIEENPKTRHMLHVADYDPVKEVRALLRRLRESLASA